MRRKQEVRETRLIINQSVEGICMEENVRSIIEGKTGITQQFEPIYTDRRDGVMPQYDIRTDRFEIAREAKDKINKYEASQIAKGENISKADNEDSTDSTEASKEQNV